jgi:hypothetical protein
MFFLPDALQNSVHPFINKNSPSVQKVILEITNVVHDALDQKAIKYSWLNSLYEIIHQLLVDLK